PFRVFHKSFADFLLEDEDNVDYHIDSQAMHRRIADYYWVHRDHWLKCDKYGLNNLAVHLAKSNKPERALELLDEDWMSARYQGGGYTYQGFAADVEVTRTQLAARGALTVKDHTRLATMYHIVGELATNFEDDDLAILVLLGRATEALAHVRLRTA